MTNTNEFVDFGSELMLRPKETVAETKMSKLSEQVEELAKLVFLFDKSGSMGGSLLPGLVKAYSWPDGCVAKIRTAFQAVADKVNVAVQAGDKPEAVLSHWNGEMSLLKVLDYNGTTYSVPALTDDKVKELVVDKDLLDYFGIRYDRSSGIPEMSKVACVKKLASQEIDRRLAKYPNSDIAVVAFGSGAEVMSKTGDRASLERAIDCLGAYDGSTQILAGISKAMAVCRESPSVIGIHHFMIVSDGGDPECSAHIAEWIPSLRASGVVLDYIHIGTEAELNQPLAAACRELKGDAVAVNNTGALETRFIEQATRLMLTA